MSISDIFDEEFDGVDLSPVGDYVGTVTKAVIRTRDVTFKKTGEVRHVVAASCVVALEECLTGKKDDLVMSDINPVFVDIELDRRTTQAAMDLLTTVEKIVGAKNLPDDLVRPAIRSLRTLKTDDAATESAWNPVLALLVGKKVTVGITENAKATDPKYRYEAGGISPVL